MDESLNQQQISFIQRLLERSKQFLALKDDIATDMTLYDELGFGAIMTDAALKSAGFDYTQSSIWNAVNAQRNVAASLDATPVSDEQKRISKSDEVVRVSLIKLRR